MADHHRETSWGGPGSSQQNADKPAPKPHDPRADGSPTNDQDSHVSGGGGERDRHHAHDPAGKSTSHKAHG
jgi:hypothetical protein